MQAYAASMQMAYGAPGPYGSPAGGGMGMPLSPVSGMQVRYAGLCSGVAEGRSGSRRCPALWSAAAGARWLCGARPAVQHAAAVLPSPG